MLIDDVVITQEDLKKILHYEPETGLFTWIAARASNKMKAGQVAGGISVQGYVRISIKAKRYLAHRLVWLYVHGHFPPDHTDHINGIKTDNRLCNLRAATHAQNLTNRGETRGRPPGAKGVYWDKRRKKWVVRCKANGNFLYFGSFNTIEAASAVYQEFAKKHHGEFYNGGAHC